MTERAKNSSDDASAVVKQQEPAFHQSVERIDKVLEGEIPRLLAAIFAGQYLPNMKWAVTLSTTNAHGQPYGALIEGQGWHPADIARATWELAEHAITLPIKHIDSIKEPPPERVEVKLPTIKRRVR